MIQKAYRCWQKRPSADLSESADVTPPARSVRSATDPRGGFTLMELMVASALMAAVMAGLWGLVNIFVNLSERGLEEFEQLNRSTALSAWLETDLRSVPGIVDEPGEPVLWGSEQELNLLCVAPPSLAWLGPHEPIPQWHEADASAAGIHALPAYSPAPPPGVAAETPPESTPARAGQPAPRGMAGATLDQSLPRPGSQAGGPSVGPSVGSFDAEEQPSYYSPPAVRRVRYRLDFSSAFSSAAIPGLPAGQSSAASPGIDPAATDDLPLTSDEPEQQLWRYGELSRTSTGEPLQTAWQFPRVEAIRFSYYDGKIWHSRWDSSRRRGLPRAVRIETWYVDGTPMTPPVDARSETDEQDFSPMATPALDASVSDEPPPADWSSAFAPLESAYLPERPADLTHWISL